MESLYLLIPVSVILVFIIGVVFWWSLKSGQMEDLEGPAYRILMDNDRPPQGTDAAPDRSKHESVDPDQSV